MAAVSALMISSCAAKLPKLPRKPLAKKPSPARVLKKKKPALSSIWDMGHCKFHDNSLSYHSYGSGKTKTVRLDMNVNGARILICSDRFTVLLAKMKAVIAIGGMGVMNGDFGFGEIGGRTTIANSYELDLTDVVKAGGKSRFASLVGTNLKISVKGGIWSINLANPFKGWDIY